MILNRHGFLAITLTITAAAALGQQQTTHESPEAAADSVASSRNIQPVVSDVTMSASTVNDVHLRPLFTTTIRLPDVVSSVAVGAPTLFEAEHSDSEPRLVYVKPSTKHPSESNLVITMQSGETISMRLISDGSSAANPLVDFIVDYRPRQSFFLRSTDTPVNASPEVPAVASRKDPIDGALEGQSRVATPAWQKGASLDHKSKKAEPPVIAGALGEVRQYGGKMLVAYSVRNQSDHWIEVLPPQIEVSSPGDNEQINKKDKKRIVEAEQVQVEGFRVNGRRLAPGQRADGAVTFERPGFKQSQERLLLQLVSANAVDKPLLLAVPFVAPAN
jgi:hypothetical protein